MTSTSPDTAAVDAEGLSDWELIDASEFKEHPLSSAFKEHTATDVNKHTQPDQVKCQSVDSTSGTKLQDHVLGGRGQKNLDSLTAEALPDQGTPGEAVTPAPVSQDLVTKPSTSPEKNTANSKFQPPQNQSVECNTRSATACAAVAALFLLLVYSWCTTHPAGPEIPSKLHPAPRDPLRVVTDSQGQLRLLDTLHSRQTQLVKAHPLSAANVESLLGGSRAIRNAQRLTTQGKQLIAADMFNRIPAAQIIHATTPALKEQPQHHEGSSGTRSYSGCRTNMSVAVYVKSPFIIPYRSDKSTVRLQVNNLIGDKATCHALMPEMRHASWTGLPDVPNCVARVRAAEDSSVIYLKSAPKRQSLRNRWNTSLMLHPAALPLVIAPRSQDLGSVSSQFVKPEHLHEGKYISRAGSAIPPRTRAS